MRMYFTIDFSPKALKQFDKLTQENKERIKNVLDRCRIRPHHHAKKLENSKLFALRAGDLRIICDIKNKQLLILIIKIGKRENVYK